MKFELDIDDYAIILNALHYYKKVEKRGNFKQYNEERVNKLRDKMAYQLIPSEIVVIDYDEWNICIWICDTTHCGNGTYLVC